MNETSLRQPVAIPLGFGLAVLISAVGLGLGGPVLAAWLVDMFDLSPLPTPGVLQVVAGLPWAWSIPIGALLGVVGGVLLALNIESEGLRLTVATDHIEYRQEDREGWIERTDVATMYPDGHYVVVLDPRERIRVRLNADGVSRSALASTMREHGYPWLDQDPFEGDYARWVDGKPGFTSGEHRLIREWRRKRRKNTGRMEAEEALREAGLVVRCRGERVEARRAGGVSDGTDRRSAAS
ncbi:YqeB family protein [Microbacterium sp. JB110]|uniref:YqeB family protein n=1 Tax=unclassified Microbacterium TaxID=2609290 RepID=UPI00097E7B54|nr:hypothetical protein [Microbacterium sp. JB110]SJM62497.1 unknown [Frigoribacterium sp. JB110]